MANDKKKKKFKHKPRKGTLYQSKLMLRRQAIIGREKRLSRMNPNRGVHKVTDTEKRVLNFTCLLGFGFFTM